MSTLPPLPSHLDPRGRHRDSGGSRWGAARLLGRVLGGLLSLALLLASGYYWQTFRTIQKNVKQYDIAVDAPPAAASASATPDFDGKDMNILLVGNDDRSNLSRSEARILKVGKDGGSLATDTMIIVHVPADGSKATLISLPRDSEVDVPGYGQQLLNAPYALAYSAAHGAGQSVDSAKRAGANLLLKTITNLTGLTINHYVQIDLLGFYRISNAIGGVPVNMCADVSDPVIAGVGGSGLVLSKGPHKIKGVTALAFVRQRHNFPDGREDLDRVARQRYFLTAAFRSVASVGILTKLADVGDAISKSIFTDKHFDMFDIAKQMEHLTADNIVGATIPTTSDGAHLAVNPTRVQNFIRKLLAKQAATPAPTSSTTPSTGATSPGTKPSSSTAAPDAKCTQ